MTENRHPGPKDWNRKITLELSVAEAWHLRSAALSQARKRRRELAKGDYVPPPGKLNANEIQANLLESSAAKLMEKIIP